MKSHTKIFLIIRAIFYENNRYYPQVSLDQCLYKRMESKSEFKKINMKNRTCYYFNDIMRVIGIDFNNILFNKKLYKNLLIYNILYKTFILFGLIK